MPTIRRLMIIISLIFVFALLTSCLEVKQAININKDGSGDAKLEVAVMVAEMVPKLKSEMPKGWNIIEEKEKEGKHIVVFGRKFRDISELNDDEIRYTFSSERKSFMKKAYTLNIKQIRSSDTSFPYEISIKVPGNIDETDGTKLPSDEVKWNLQGFRRGKELSVKSSGFAMPDFASLKESFNTMFNSLFYREAIVFMQDNNIWVMDGNGKNQRQVTQEGIKSFSVSKNGKVIAYVDELKNCHILNREDGFTTRLADISDCYDVEVSQDGKKAAFVKIDEKLNIDEARQIILVVASNGNPIEYAKEGDVKRTGIYGIDLTTNKQRKYAGELPSQLLPEAHDNIITMWRDDSLFWSPKENILHFRRDFTPYREEGEFRDTYLLHLNNDDNAEIKYIGRQTYIVGWIGEKILYTAEGYFSFYDSATKKRQDLGSLGYAAISSDGKKMAYAQFSNKKEGDNYVWWDTLYVKDMSSGKIQKLLTSAKKEHFEDISWNLGGTKILFSKSTEKRETNFFFSIDSDGSNLKKLTDVSIKTSFPKWTATPRVTFLSPSTAKTMIFLTIAMIGILFVFGIALVTRKTVKAVIPKIPKIPQVKTIPKGSFCTQCGRENSQTASFCTHCGQRLKR